MQQDELQNQIIRLLMSPGYNPQKAHGIMRSLSIDPALRRSVRHALRELHNAGTIVLLRGNRFAIGERGTVLTGSISMHPNGFGFVMLDPDQENAPEEDVFVPPNQSGLARHGDRVKVELVQGTSNSRRNRGPEGRIIDVLERGNSRIVGTLQKQMGAWQLVPDDPRYTEVIHIHDPAAGVSPQEMHKFVVDLNDRGSPNMVETGTLVEDLGHVDAGDVDVLAIMRTHGLAEEFPGPVQRESKAFHPGIPGEEYETRRDLRDWTCCTIDPDDARDFDDALTWQELPNGGVRLAVHIADVAYFVKPGTAIDDEAQRRGNSAYLVDRVVSMLPSNLTTDLCSLVPNEDRLAHSVIMEFDRDLNVTSRETCHSIIHSRARLTYRNVQQWMNNGEQGTIPDDMVKSVRGLRKLAARLRRERFQNSALTFNVPEVRCVLNDEGHVTGFEKREGMEAYQLVEECMLVANREVGAMLAARFDKAIYRIHEEPEEKNWEKMAEDLRALGMGERPLTRETLNEIVSPDLPEAMKLPVTIAILKNLNRARYSENRQEHFGLAFDSYSHFTSPIRRYPDLIAHRMLDALAANEDSPYTAEELRELCQHCSTTERNAEEAEKATVAVRRLQYYHRKLWNGETGPFPALVSGLSAKGLQVELLESQQRGLIPFHAFGDDYYEINEAGTRARGRHNGHIFSVGDELDVLLAKVDIQLRRIDLVPDEGGYKSRRERMEKKKFKGKGKGKGRKGKGGKRKR